MPRGRFTYSQNQLQWQKPVKKKKPPTASAAVQLALFAEQNSNAAMSPFNQKGDAEGRGIHSRGRTRRTSAQSFHSADTQQARLSQKEIVFRCIQQNAPVSDRDIAQRTGLSLTVIPDRRGCLLREGRIIIDHISRHPETKQEVTYYAPC